jgi:DNA-binding response OmpR family regulator
LPRVDQALDVAVKPGQVGPFPRVTEGSPVFENAPPKAKEAAHRILVVEDDISIRQLNTEMLIRSGYEVDGAADGEAGWEALQAKRYDLLITDNLMPKVTGIEMIKKVYAAGMQVPVIMATAILPQEEFISNPWLEAVPTLLKPFRGTELLTTVRNVLSARDGIRK